MTVRILGTKPVYDGWVTLHLATLADQDGQPFEREIEDHGSAVAVLPYDPERLTALLVQLPRAPVLFLGEACDFLEAPAGILDRGEEPEHAARREASEEVGVALHDLEPAGRVWSMAGVSTERIQLYLAPYRAADRTGKGGGLAEEHENITVVEKPLSELAQLADRNGLADMKTLALLMTLRVRHPHLFS